MDNLGDKIAKLRKKKNMTQIELGELLHVSDKTISKWEQGKSNPSYEFLDEMSKVFDVKIEYFLKDGSLENRFKLSLSYSWKFVKTNWNKIIFTLLFIFFAAYFFITIDSLEMYEIKDENKQDAINFDNGYYIKSKSKIIIYINNIECNLNENDVNSQKIKLYTLYNDEKKYFYESDELEDVAYKDFIGYALDRKMVKNLTNNLYLEIETLHNDNTFTKKEVKLNLKKAISSNTIFYNDKLSVNNEQENNKTKSNISSFDLVKNGYTQIKDSAVYFKNKDNYQLYFDLSVKVFRYNLKDGDKLEKVSFYYNQDEIIYNFFNKNEVILHFDYYNHDNNLHCYDGNCDDYLKIYEDAKAFFYKTINEFSKS